LKTPYGAECSFFYGNYYRGKSDEECRLLIDQKGKWNSSLCKTCPMPGIQRANSCKFMRFRAEITRKPLSLFQAKVEINAFCEKTSRVVESPHVGCGECHPNLEIFENFEK